MRKRKSADSVDQRLAFCIQYIFTIYINIVGKIKIKSRGTNQSIEKKGKHKSNSITGSWKGLTSAICFSTGKMIVLKEFGKQSM